jgi:succinoglycan biosynthesis protein ExoO
MSHCSATPKVSVAVANYNAAPFISAAVRSALQQTLQNIEVIIVDDCSTDNSLEVLDQLAGEDGRVRVVRLAHNSGPSAARNAALRLARGCWFAVLDSDDLFAPERLERLVHVAEQMGADIISDNLFVFDDGFPTRGRLHLANPGPGRWLSLPDYLKETRMFGGGLEYGFLKPVMNRHRLHTLMIEYDEGLRIAEDDDLILRAMLAGMTYWLEPLPTYAYRKRIGSISHRLPVAAAEAMTFSSGRLRAKYGSGPHARNLRRRHLAYIRALEFSRLIRSLTDGSIREALKVLLRTPSMIPLLRMPLGAKAARLLRLQFKGERVLQSKRTELPSWISLIKTTPEEFISNPEKIMFVLVRQVTTWLHASMTEVKVARSG